jgi:hypothetical protein
VAQWVKTAMASASRHRQHVLCDELAQRLTVGRALRLIAVAPPTARWALLLNIQLLAAMVDGRAEHCADPAAC